MVNIIPTKNCVICHIVSFLTLLKTLVVELSVAEFLVQLLLSSILGFHNLSEGEQSDGVRAYGCEKVLVIIAAESDEPALLSASSFARAKSQQFSQFPLESREELLCWSWERRAQTGSTSLT